MPRSRRRSSNSPRSSRARSARRTDIVQKEMYTFTDRGGDEITLRPEYTAGIVRAVISNGLTQSLPLKLFASGPMFRYERPQKGRFRQFHQIDVELIGVAQPLGDVEVIALGAEILDALGVLAKTELEINTLGDTDEPPRLSRRARRLLRRRSATSCQRGQPAPARAQSAAHPRFEGPGRQARQRRRARPSPTISRRTRAASSTRCWHGLDALGIAYRLNPRLVRGLDYYCHTAFEFVTDALGAQGTVLGGGRYDGLMGVMGGPETPGVGWAAGIERLALLIAEPPPPPRPIALVPLGEAAEATGAHARAGAAPRRLRRRARLFRQSAPPPAARRQDQRARRGDPRRQRARSAAPRACATSIPASRSRSRSTRSRSGSRRSASVYVGRSRPRSPARA